MSPYPTMVVVPVLSSTFEELVVQENDDFWKESHRRFPSCKQNRLHRNGRELFLLSPKCTADHAATGKTERGCGSYYV